MTRAGTVRGIEESGVVAVIRLNDSLQLRAATEALAAGGVRAMEVTMTTPGALRLIEELAESLPSEVLIGAGTVLNFESAQEAIAAGAAFIVSPVFHRALIDIGHQYDVAVMPGCFTPTEILTAWESGADIVKVFPASVLGPAFLKDLRGPLPQIRLMPTGGVNVENAGDWLRAGAVAIGAGTALVDAKAIAAGRFDIITANARAFVETVQRARAD